MENEDYASDSDQSDEDYCPLKEKSEVLSEEESGGDESAADSDNDGESSASTKKAKKPSASKKKAKPLITSFSRKRKSTVIEEETSVPSEPAVADDKSHADALWASFLGDGDSSSAKSTASQPAIKKVIVTETLEFAGEKIEVRKEVAVKNESDLFAISGAKRNNVKTEEALKPTKMPIVQGLGALGSLRKSNVGCPAKSGGGLSAVLGQIGKKNKISVLEKTALDWKSFKHSEGIDEQLQTHNKGKDGYLERQDFLQRTDVRQFEIEKDLRQAKRNHR